MYTRHPVLSLCGFKYSQVPNRRAGMLINFRKKFVPTFSLFRATRLLFQTFFSSQHTNAWCPLGVIWMIFLVVCIIIEFLVKNQTIFFCIFVPSFSILRLFESFSFLFLKIYFENLLKLCNGYLYNISSYPQRV